MDLSLDPRSIAAVAALSGLLLAIVLGSAHRDARHIPGVLSWMWGCIAVSLAFAQNAWFPYINPNIAYVFGNIGLNVAVHLMWRGAQQFSYRRAPLWPIWAVILFTAVWGWLFGVYMPNHSLRSLTFSLMTALWCVAAAWAFLRNPDPAMRLGKRIAGWALGLFTFMMLARAYQGLFSASPSSLNVRVPINAATQLAGSMVLLSTMVGIIVCINARLASEARKLAYEDMLTGALNRRGLYEALPRWLAEHGQGASVALIDLDYFKSVNDRLGHAAGDELLRLLVKLCQQHAPANSVFARLGGDEFVLLMPAGQDAQAITQQITSAFTHASQTALPLSAFDPKPGLSIGIASVQDTHIHAFDEATRAADAQLYRIKGLRHVAQRYLRHNPAQVFQPDVTQS
jgi:diguanylate cyclase (GGDEF)-like protein